MIYITRKFHFAASHRVCLPELSDEENNRIFGKCANPNGHGHNYILEVTIAGEVNQETGYVMNLIELKEIINTEIIDRVDHKNFNTDVDFMKGINPTTENIVKKFWELVADKIKTDNRKLYSMKLTETVNNSVEYRGE